MFPNVTDPGMFEQERLVRYEDLRPCTNAFVDARTPGSDRKENFTIIGPGVSENPDQHIHISLPHGFNIGGARQPPRCVNSQHSHLTAEVFIVHSGRWAFRSGETGHDGEVILERGDVVSLPPRMFRGFENVGDNMGFLFAVLGGDDPGHVLWAPQVFDEAQKYGLILLENGRLIDTTLGQVVPLGARRMPKPSPEQVLDLDTYDHDALLRCVSRSGRTTPSPGSVLAGSGQGVTEGTILGPGHEGEGLLPAPIGRSHGFVLRQLTFTGDGSIPLHTRAEEEVLIVHQGALRVTFGKAAVEVRSGDVLTVPIQQPRAFANADTGPTIVHVVRRGERPAPPVFLD